ncbi:MAG: MAPEG family protein [Caulobacteraceae bacterium]
MTSDLWALFATLALATAQLSASSLLTLRQLGPAWVLSPRDQVRETVGVTGRVARAYRNLLESFPQFLAALFLVHAAHTAGALSAIGAWLFFAGRLAYLPAYLFGAPGVRPACWLAAQTGVFVILANLFVR